VGLTTLQGWRRQFTGDGDGVDRRMGSHRNAALPAPIKDNASFEQRLAQLQA
jgi:hypothetical protein